MTKIFGIGLSRTGTKSLISALRKLGYSAIHYPNLTRMFNLSIDIEAMADTPVCIHYITLDTMYKNSKFILTTRDLNDWLSSAKWFFSQKRQKILSPQQIFIREILYGAKYFNEKTYKEGFLTYHDKVYQYFKDRPEDLLIMNIVNNGEGWEKLCTFLDKPKPNIPFPHDHRRLNK